jgi:chemotaxis protein CheD
MELTVGIGECVMGREGDHLKSILGSCVGLCLWDRNRKIGAMAHVMLPRYRDVGRKEKPGKYADRAVETLKGLLAEHVSFQPVAKLVGGASMFGRAEGFDGILSVGLMNQQALRENLRKEGIQLVFEDVGGSSGRTVIFDCGTGELSVKICGKGKLVG